MPRPDRPSAAAPEPRRPADVPRRPADAPAGRLRSNPYIALLPLRFFLGVMLLYAGLDKLQTAGFLQEAGAGSIGEQLHGFLRASPLAPLVAAFALQAPVLVGLLIALAEIAIGLGTLTGIAYRASAALGAFLALLFWLTASWTVRPYYLGPDLPYAAGWITLALAGHGDLLVLGPALTEWFGGAKGPLGRTVGANGRPVPYRKLARMPARWSREVSPERRAVLELGVLALAALAVGAAGGLFGRLLRGGSGGDERLVALGGSSGSGSDASPTLAPSDGTTASGGSAAATASADGAGTTGGSSGSSGTAIARLDQLSPRQAMEFSDPATGDPSVLVRLADGRVVAFDAICTHAGCVVGYDQGSGLLLCPCHGAAFDPTHNADVVAGPAPVALPSLPIRIDRATGAITLLG